MKLINKKTKEVVMESLFDGRCSHWFNSIDNMDEHFLDNPAYKYLPAKYGVNEYWPEEDAAAVEGEERWAFHPYTIEAKAYYIWFCEHRPNFYAGWTRRYDAWCMENYNSFNLDDLYHYLPEDAIKEDWVFIENVEDKYNCDASVINEITNYIADYNNKKEKRTDKVSLEDFVIIYYFDH